MKIAEVGRDRDIQIAIYRGIATGCMPYRKRRWIYGIYWRLRRLRNSGMDNMEGK